MLEFYVYILKCSDESYYTGHTDNIDGRISQHKHGLIPSCYTYTRLPVEIVYVATFASRGEALAAERQIKGWSRRKKEALINEEFFYSNIYLRVKNNFQAYFCRLRSPFDRLRANGIRIYNIFHIKHILICIQT